VKAAALLLLAIAACDMPVSEQGPAGPRGARGAQGMMGEAGRDGRDATITTYVVHGETEVAPGDWSTAVAQCDKGDRVLTGGCEWGAFTTDGYQMGAVVPYLDTPIGQELGPDSFTSWQCQGQSVVEHETRIYAVAVCLEGGES